MDVSPVRRQAVRTRTSLPARSGEREEEVRPLGTMLAELNANPLRVRHPSTMHVKLEPDRRQSMTVFGSRPVSPGRLVAEAALHDS